MTYIIPSWCHTSSNMIVHLMKIGTSFLKSLYPWKYIGKDGTKWNHCFVGISPMTHWFLYLGQTLWRDHMKSLFCRERSDDTFIFTCGTNTLKGPHKSSFCQEWSHDTLIFIFGTNTLTGPHEIIILSGLVRWNIDFYIWDKHSNGTSWRHYFVGISPMTHWFLYLGQTLWRDHMTSLFFRG